MKRNHLIIVGQSVVIVFLVAYAFFQQKTTKTVQQSAITAMEKALEYRDMADNARKEADMQRIMAQQAAQEAQKQNAIAFELLQKLDKRK